MTTDTSQRLLILADDLTGAADCAARCRHAGLPATIFLQPPHAPLPSGAVSFTSDSRHLAPTAAAQRVRAAVAHLRGTGHGVWYKKIDSTLRGNLGAELEALLTIQTDPQPGMAAAPPCAVISPAFPAQGRGLQDGRLVMDGQETSAIHLPTLLRAQTDLPLAVVPLERVRQGIQPVVEALQQGQRSGARLFVVDGLSDADLRIVVEATQRALPHALFCGSAGLVGVLAERWPDTGASDAPKGADVQASAGRVLAVVGSGSAMAHRQLHTLADSPDVCIRQTEPGDSVGFADGCTRWVIHLPPPPADALLDGPHARQLATHLAETAARTIRDLQPERIILVGGDTAIATLEKLGVRQLTVVHEVLPGMPLTTAVDRCGRTLQVVLKAGNHGDAQTLVTLMKVTLMNR